MLLRNRLHDSQSMISFGMACLAIGIVAQRFIHPPTDFWQGFVAGLSGMLIGYLYLKKEWKFSDLPDLYYDRKRRRRIKLVEKENTATRQEREEVDRILDKISARGMESLTRKELKILERVSSRKKGK